MSDPFESSRRKIAWAKKNLAKLDRKTAAFFKRRNLYEPFVEPHPDRAEFTTLKIRFLHKLPSDFEEITGDILSNLRAALDHAVYGVARDVALSANSPKPKLETACFPFAKDAAHFESALKGRCASVPTELHPVFRDCKPYGGGNEALWALNTIRGTNEHVTLVPAVTSAFVGGMDIRGIGGWTMPYRPILDSSKNEMEICSLASGAKLHGKLQLAMCVAFGEIEGIGGKNAGEVLQLFSEVVTTIVDRIEAESKRLGIVK